MKLQVFKGPAITFTAGILLYLLMFFPRVNHWGMIIGIALLAILAIGVLFWMNAIRSETVVPKENEPASESDKKLSIFSRVASKFNIRILYLGLSCVIAGVCRISVLNTMGAAAPWSGPFLFGAAAILILAAYFFRKPWDGNFHEGFLVFWATFAMVMATLGSQGLWDCWETHYGEVARRQLEQDDWISLFWEDQWFYSKPILIFWMMNLGMALFGVDVRPDSISGHAEWGIRFMAAMLSVFVIWGIYKLLAERVSKRAGLFAAIILVSMPMWGFMARQAITDMPFVGFMTLAVVLFLLGITADKNAICKPLLFPIWKNKKLSIGAFHALIVGYITLGVPQFLYLASRSASFRFGTYGREDIKVVLSKFRLTNIKLSDIANSFLGLRINSVQDISLDWLLLGVVYIIPFALILFSIRKERRISKLCFHGMYIFLALSVMAKGLAGLVLPILALFVYGTVKSPWHLLLTPKQFFLFYWDNIKRIEIPRGIVMFLLLASPWYIAMTVRHGMAFINRFFIHDHFKRLAEGVHGESGTFQYFLEQFAYAAFPFSALLPFAMLAWFAVYSKDQSLLSDSERAGKTIRLFMTSLAIVSYALFTMMVTKFHHYVFPLIIPSAVLIGMLIDDIWHNRLPKVGMIAVVALVIVGVVAKDLVVDPVTKAKGVIDGHTQLVGLFIYKYSRPYPEGEAYNFFLPLLTFSIIFGTTFIGWTINSFRRFSIVLTLLAGLAFSHFISQHYMVQLAPHWTQKHIIEEYYLLRESDEERLVAFQMNWKGENFYTGNRVIPYVSTRNKQFDEWVGKHRGQRHFFLTEHSRFERMNRRIKAKSGDLEPLSDTCNKYKTGVADQL